MGQRTLTDLLKEKALVIPNEKVVSVWGKFDLTYAQLCELVDHAAALLMGHAVGAGDVVALAFPTTVEFVIMLLAVMRCRATAAPLDPAYSAEEFWATLSEAKPKLLLVPQEGNELAQFAAFGLSIPYLTAKLDSADSKITLSSSDIKPDLDSLSKVVNDCSDVALFLQLDGSTLELTHLNLTAKAYLNIGPRHPSPAYTGLVWDLLFSLVAGNDVVLPVAREAASSGPRRFSYDHLLILNGQFRNSRMLGEGGSGTVYEGHVYIGYARTRVAVKIIKSDSEERTREFASEVMTLSQLSHPNLVQLIGCCDESDKLVLIYEFMSGGTLDDRLFNEGGVALTWERRHKIAQELASALHYMHERSDMYVIHRDIKSSNIMLDEEKAKLGDFGLARLVDCTIGPKTTEKIGTYGYAPWEYCFTGKATKETDVFSFGVVLLELASGRRVVDKKRDPEDLVAWVWKLYGSKKLLDAVDWRLGQIFDKEQAKALMMVGLWCAHPIASSRPSIAEAEAFLKGDAKPPTLPSKMPQSQNGGNSKGPCGCFKC